MLRLTILIFSLENTFILYENSILFTIKSSKNFPIQNAYSMKNFLISKQKNKKDKFAWNGIARGNSQSADII